MTTGHYTTDSLFAAEQGFAPRCKIQSGIHEKLHQVRQNLAKDLPSVWHQVAVWIVAPVLAGYAHWLAQQSHGHRQFCFLGVMREGRLLSQLIKNLFNIPAQEVWLNRSLSMLAAFGCGDDEALVNWLVRTRMQSLRHGEVVQYLLLNSSAGANAQTRITLENVYDLIKAWKISGELDAARLRMGGLANRLIRHWQSTCAVSAPVLLADFACAGNIQRSLQTIFMTRKIRHSVIGLNFVMTRGSQWAESAGCVMQGYLGERGQPSWFAEAYGRTPELIEIFTAAPLGPLLDYSADGKPITGKSFLTLEQTSLIQNLQEHILSAAKIYHEALGDGLTAELSRCLWGRLLLEPLTAEAQTMADWPLDAGLDSSARRVLAPRLPNDSTGTKMQTAWPAASRIKR